ncbi:RagB/SusD family nutrient uptake outer membrane protein [Flaviaesturariibacter amylovorans]|uniref:RagB/SusD domain-containing protein n=1 Tax=Flaviaesturariibacter amylovorans TaxID=1084520 RepID=A0ABP8GMW1_9BACT
MKYRISKLIYTAGAAALLLGMGSCKKDYTDPSSVPSDQAFTTSQTLTAVATGLQRTYTAGRASSLFNRITLDGLLTNQYTVINQGNIAEYQLGQGGGTVDGTNTILGGLWTSSNKIIYDADQVIAGAAGLGDRGYASGLVAYATIMKALALGDLAMYWEKVPAGIGERVTFVDRADAYTRAIAAINAAQAGIAATPITAGFLANIPSGIDIPNTLNALKARYSLFLGNYSEALAAANAVDLTKRSVFSFNTVNLNPVFETSTSTNNVVSAAANFGLPAGLQPDPNDRRIRFYQTAAYASRIAGFDSAAASARPIYLPGEITLIKAEAYARMTPPDLANALIELNKVITKQPSADPFGVGAGLPPVVLTTQQAILDEIYRQRSIELALSGLRLEDMRRFNRPLTERKRNFLPYPFLERDNNPNTPADPAF